jgi:hypothetical protein
MSLHFCTAIMLDIVFYVTYSWREWNTLIVTCYYYNSCWNVYGKKLLKIQDVWDVPDIQLVNSYWRFGSTTLLRNASSYLPVDTFQGTYMYINVGCRTSNLLGNLFSLCSFVLNIKSIGCSRMLMHMCWSTWHHISENCVVCPRQTMTEMPNLCNVWSSRSASTTVFTKVMQFHRSSSM